MWEFKLLWELDRVRIRICSFWTGPLRRSLLLRESLNLIITGNLELGLGERAWPATRLATIFHPRAAGDTATAASKREINQHLWRTTYRPDLYICCNSFD